MMKENKHLTKKGLDKIHKIKAGMNRGREKIKEIKAVINHAR